MTAQDWTNGQAADFGRQLALSEHRQLFDYWLSLKTAENWPSKEAIKPAAIPKLLRHLLLLEMRPLPTGVCVHLAGSETWEIYGGELTGATLSDERWGAHADYWRRVYTALQEAPQPMNGHLPRFNGREHMALFWLRLPLRDRRGGLWLLGLDMVTALAEDEVSPLHNRKESPERSAPTLKIAPSFRGTCAPSAEPRPHVVLRQRGEATPSKRIVIS